MIATDNQITGNTAAADLVDNIKEYCVANMLIRQWGDILCGGTEYLDPDIRKLRQAVTIQYRQQQNATTKIQSAFRGYKERKEMQVNSRHLRLLK